MAEIKDCIGKSIKISKNSITIKDNSGKTCGVVRNITSLYDMQANKQFEYYGKLKKLGLHGKISIKEIIIADGKMYVFRDLKGKLWHEKHGYFSENEKKSAEEKEMLYKALQTAGIEVIECIFM